MRLTRRATGYAVSWLLAVGLAVAVATAAVSTVGASIRGRGPLGSELPAQVRADAESSVVPDPSAPVRRDTISGDWGEFVVACQGVWASAVAARPASGWRVVSYEPGPDDDVDAVFSRARVSVDLEVFCNRGEPTVAEEERNTLPVSSVDQDD